jgi:hypothetical protein
MLQEITLHNYKQLKSLIDDYQFVEKQPIKAKKDFILYKVFWVDEFEPKEIKEAEVLIKDFSEGVLNMMCSEPGLMSDFREYIEDLNEN